MKAIAKKSIALVLVLLQLFVLLPVGTVTAKAVNEPQAQTPILNETIVGTVKFQSFNFLGNNESGEDGTDYQTTFYYTDDYFAPSAINSAVGDTVDPDRGIDDRKQNWDMLENPSLAACSMDFAVASYTSAKDDVLRASSQTWNNSSYNREINENGYRGKVKERNVREFLTACKFSNIECTNMDIRPQNDTIAYTIASKQITVWNAELEQNETCTLVAVGVRGAGYGAEWASNITIGDPASSAMPTNGRHFGFDDNAQKVCRSIRDYLGDHSITGKVKYWVTGFSRAAAVANLVAGYLTDDPTAYHTSGRSEYGCPDVYGYTWECPQAASVNEIALQYKNIHNILNPMDAVPKVSPDKFDHQRLGVDYRMPFHGNVTSPSQNTTLYGKMYEVLKTIAVGNGKTTDPLVNDPDVSGADDGYVSPSVYPYNKVMTIYRMDGAELIDQVVDYYFFLNPILFNNGSDKLLKEFGTVQAEQEHGSGWSASGNVGELLGWNRQSDYKTSTWYLDDFVDHLIDVFLTSYAWIGGTGVGRDPIANRTTFIQNYQADFRTLFGYFLDFSGPAFLDMIPKLVDAVTNNIGGTITSGFAWNFLRFYNDPSNISKKNNLINSSKTLAVNVANSMVNGFPDPEYQRITKAQMNAAIQNLAELVINLYSFELSKYDSQYLGTTLRYLWEILCTHEQETVLSWIMSLDKNHMNRNTRTIMVPAGCNAKLLEFRAEYAQYDGNLEDADAAAPVVAEWKNGVFTSKDDRITYSGSSGSTGYAVIRYPASLSIRVDVTSAENLNLSYGAVAVDDYRTGTETQNVSKGKGEYQKVLSSGSKPSTDGYEYLTTKPNLSNAGATNTAISGYGTLQAGDTLHVIAKPTEKYSDKLEYQLLVDKKPRSVVSEYTIKTVLANPVDKLIDGTDESCFGIEQRNLLWNSEFEPTSSTYQYTGEGRRFDEYDLSVLSQTKTAMAADTQSSIETRHTVSVTPAACIYYDDTLLSSGESVSAVSTAPDYKSAIELIDHAGASVTDSSLVSFRFTGTRVDVYLNTTSATGNVIAYLLDEDGNRYQQENVLTGKAVNGKSDGSIYNVPVISFSGLNSDTYTLVLIVPNGKSISLDGVRVYDETKASYTCVRETLLSTEDWTGEKEVSGTVYLDYGKNGSAEKADYTAAGPKGEVYLKKDNGVAFEIGNYEAAATYRIGLASADGNSVQVKINDGTPFTVSATTHMFYDLDLTSKNVVLQVTSGSGILSVTDVEETLPTKLAAPRRLSLSVSPALMRYAVSLSAPAEPEETAEPSPEVTEEPTPDVTPEPTTESTPEPTSDISSMIQQLLSSFVSSLFGSISRLFGN